jgi:hypothetical protein
MKTNLKNRNARLREGTQRVSKPPAVIEVEPEKFSRSFECSAQRNKASSNEEVLQPPRGLILKAAEAERQSKKIRF